MNENWRCAAREDRRGGVEKKRTQSSFFHHKTQSESNKEGVICNLSRASPQGLRTRVVALHVSWLISCVCSRRHRSIGARFPASKGGKRRDQRERARGRERAESAIKKKLDASHLSVHLLAAPRLRLHQLLRVTKTSRKHGPPRSNVRRRSTPAPAAPAAAAAAPCPATGRRRSCSGRGRGGATASGIGGSHASRRRGCCRFLPL